MLTIGDVAARADLRASAIRYYEAEGLLPVAVRRHGRRVYDASVFQRLAVIELAKAAGFNLTEIRDLLSLVGKGHPAGVWKQLAKAKRVEIEREMRTLALMKRLVSGIGRCHCESLDDCGRAFTTALAKYAVQIERDWSEAQPTSPTRPTRLKRRTSARTARAADRRSPARSA